MYTDLVIIILKLKYLFCGKHDFFHIFQVLVKPQVVPNNCEDHVHPDEHHKQSFHADGLHDYQGSVISVTLEPRGLKREEAKSFNQNIIVEVSEVSEAEAGSAIPQRLTTAEAFADASSEDSHNVHSSPAAKTLSRSFISAKTKDLNEEKDLNENYSDRSVSEALTSDVFTTFTNVLNTFPITSPEYLWTMLICLILVALVYIIMFLRDIFVAYINNIIGMAFERFIELIVIWTFIFTILPY